MRATPFAHVILMKQNGNYCDSCALPPSDGAKLSRCSACKYEYYCGRSCQRSSWNYHKFECPLLKRRLPKVPADSVRLLTRIIWNISHRLLKPDDDPGYRNFLELCDHFPEYLEEPARSRQLHEMSFTLNNYIGSENLCSMLAGTIGLPRIFGRMIFNGFTLTHMGEEVGVAVYISPSVFDHSCAPNASCVNDGTCLSVRALRDVDTGKESLLVNYLDPLIPRSKRLEELESNYRFTCRCTKCLDEDQELMFEAVICPQCQGTAVRLPDGIFHCQKCHAVIDDPMFLRQIVRDEEEAWCIVEEAKKHDNMDRLKRFLSRNTILAASSVYIAMLNVTLYAYECQFGNSAVAYDIGEALTKTYRQHYPECFAMHGEHQFKQARLAWQMDEYEKALLHYRAAIGSLTVSHGTDHQRTKLAQSDMRDCERDKFIYDSMRNH